MYEHARGEEGGGEIDKEELHESLPSPRQRLRSAAGISRDQGGYQIWKMAYLRWARAGTEQDGNAEDRVGQEKSVKLGGMGWDGM